MNVLLLDQTGSFLDFALRCNKAGHHTRTCMAYDKQTGQRRKIGDGLIEKIEREEWQRHMGWADLVLTSDNVKWLRELDVWRKRGYPVFAPSYESAQLELDRGKGQAFLKANGVQTMDYEVFTNYRKALDHVEKNMKRYVSKPFGDKDKALTHCSKGPRDMCFMLERWDSEPKHDGTKFMLQEFVPGVEFAVNAWMGRKGFAQYIEESFEHKKFMPGDIGPNTGEMGTAIKYVSESELADEVLWPLERALMKIGHTGSVDVSAIIDENGVPQPLEFTVRPGWPAFNIVQSLHQDPIEWMAELLDGDDTFRPSTQHAIGVVVTIPDFPNSRFTKKEVSGIPVYDLDDENKYREFLAPCELMEGMAPDEVDGKMESRRLMVSCGDYLVVATGLGDSVREAKKEADKVVESIEIPTNPQYRYDIGDRLRAQIPKLQEFGFATDWRY